MYLDYDEKKLMDVLKTFHILTGLRLMLFDADYNKILSYPEEDCSFCAMIKSSETGMERCMESDIGSFGAAAKSGDLCVYRCHAGLIEATMPLKESGAVTGYLMFGQVTDDPDKSHLIESIKELCEICSIDSKKAMRELERIEYQPQEKITAAAKLLEICTSYIILQELVIPESDRIILRLDEYIDSHISSDLRVSVLCKELGISRTRLYALFSSQGKNGIAAYVRGRRIKVAKRLLRTTSLAVSQIAENVGFADYNYFCRVFREMTGRSPNKYRRLRADSAKAQK